MQHNRRTFLFNLGRATAGAGLLGGLPALLTNCTGGENSQGESQANTQQASQPGQKDGFFDISLAEWSLHKALFANQMTNMDFPAKAKNDFNIDVVEFVSVFFNKKEQDETYMKELLHRTKDLGVRNHLIMVDAEGELGDLDQAKRLQAVENHYKWIDAAKYLGCTTIRVNAAGNGTADEVRDAAVDGLGRLAEHGAKNNINVVVENHGGYSSNAQWLASVMQQVNNPRLGTLPDFGNFCIKRSEPTEGSQGTTCIEEYDRYKGVAELMPYAKAVSAKSFYFDAQGNETTIDYPRMMQIVKDAGFEGFVGIEYEGDRMSEEEGIRATRDLLIRVRSEMA